ncbi:hypothetical protein B0T19DRAFT_219714 [Cercophora scortea]|uniref:Uncharacterized protein n=1 Tax=Cercophora scortea TaxID=314031 RepID=A0AAE0IGT3_9PEZI|nr:hypothetical protein B0T19DRAFT_219714 [Cercophora scortea]
MADSDDRYFVYENRLASFQGPHPVAKKRASNASSRAPKALHWPHKSLLPSDLAKAGFFFEPFPGSPDNAVCFLCNKALDGWEEDDNPLEEHLKHSPTCGWAVTAAIEAELGEYGQVHPLDPAMIEARKATFGGRWPYESKKGFKCKTKQLSEAGWKYTPTFESDDMATCAYCQLALDGWESGDKPIDEHYKRSPDCPFFTLISQNPAPKKSRAKAARTSKASRLSTQSIATVATGVSDVTSIADTAEHDDSVMTTASVMTQGGKKATKAKKAPAAKGRKTKAKKDEVVEILEDEPQEIQAPPPQKATRGRKRVSDDVEDSAITNSEAPAPKKRATKKKANTASTQDTSSVHTESQDVELADAAPPKKPAARKKAAAKRTRKGSTSSVISQASTVSVRGNVPDDAEIDRQLQADLDRPLTDDEDLAADSDSGKRKAPAPARGRPKKAAAASTQKATRQSQEHSQAFSMLDPAPVKPDEDEIQAELLALEAEMETQNPPVETLTVPKKGRKAGTRKPSKQAKKPKEVLPSDPIDELMMDDAPVQYPTLDLAPEPVKETKPEPNPEPELPDDPDASTGTVVAKDTSRASIGKRGRGRPPKNSTSSVGVADEAEPRRSSGVPVQIEVQIESRTRESFSAFMGSPKELARKPVPPPAVSQAGSEPRSEPETMSPVLHASTPAKVEKALPLPPPQSATRLPQPPATPPRASTRPSASAKQATMSPSQSPQCSDAENQPPSSKQRAGFMTTRPVLAPVASTPARSSPSKQNVVAGLQSATPWTAVDLEGVFSPVKDGEKENGVARLLRKGGELTSPEKGMTVEEWIYHNAGLAEQKLRHECEVMVSAFEKEGSRAMGVLEDLIVE